MRAVVCHELGAPFDRLLVEERDTPPVGPNDVRVAIRAAGASFVDGLMAAGRYQFPMPPPYVPGGEAAGVVEEVGEAVTDWKVGDRVFASTMVGAFADTMVVRDRQLYAMPDGLDFGRAASFLQVYGTAWFTFTRRTTVRSGEVVLVTGAGGGVGLAAVDVARSLGARVIAVASSEEKRSLAMAAGAESAIDSSSEDIKVRARELTGGEGVDIVYDVVGGDVSEPALRALKFDGRFCVVGFPGGIAKVPLNLVLLNNRTVVGVEWGGWVMRSPAENREMVGEVVAAIASGSLHPVAPVERPLADAGAVLADLLERRAAGKIVLVP